MPSALSLAAELVLCFEVMLPVTYMNIYPGWGGFSQGGPLSTEQMRLGTSTCMPVCSFECSQVTVMSAAVRYVSHKSHS